MACHIQWHAVTLKFTLSATVSECAPKKIKQINCVLLKKGISISICYEAYADDDENNTIYGSEKERRRRKKRQLLKENSKS